MLEHDAVTCDTQMAEKPMDAHFPRAATMGQKVALVFCMNPSVPMNLVEDAFFKQAFGHPFGRNGLPQEIFLLAEGRRTLQVFSILSIFVTFKESEPRCTRPLLGLRLH